MSTSRPTVAAIGVVVLLMVLVLGIQVFKRTSQGAPILQSLALGREWSYKIGDADPDRGQGTVRPISTSFSPKEADALYKILNSEEFQSRLKKYAGDEPVPPLKFTVSIFEARPRSTRRILIQERPPLSPSGRQRGMMFGLGYQIDVEFAKLDPTKGRVGREPRCDFSLRDSNEEWVFFDAPKPNEKESDFIPKP